ncbi:hypothetical protein BDM02DRAFT_3120497 [Thelephora ganbajun]|uniref:Uncharacterized protein n=1 Tax=Thelephora ganbajun TaxID=370292 RepID=A0ACB6Z6V3_THEGA|nr:hypothetical protein BDM02DRAFT_3120497 [Thelephora ganbajun]
MTILEPRTVDNMLPIVGSHSATIAALNADAEALTAIKDKLEITPVKVVFESVIGFLDLARVRVPVLGHFSYSFPDDAVRTR